jgi:hypothetical protein
MDARTREGDVHQVSLLNANATTLSSAAVVGGQRFTIADTRGKGAWSQMHELHVSETAAFTPSTSTLRAAGEQSSFDVPSLVPGKTYYWQVVPFTLNADRLVRGSPSAERSFVAGRASAGHLDQLALLGVPNPQFASALDQPSAEVYGTPPDHWSIVAGTWGATSDAYAALAGTSQYRMIRLRQTATSAQLQSSVFPIERGAVAAKLLAVVSPNGTYSAGRDLHFVIDFFSDLGNTSTGSVDLVCPGNIVGAGSWAEYSSDLAVPAGSNFARVKLYKEATSSAYGFDVATVALRALGPLAQPAWTAPSYVNSFSDFGASFLTAGYYKDSTGRVWLRGLAKRATAALSTTIFTLPAGSRPSANANFIVMANNRMARLEIASAGTVQIIAADDASWFNFFSFDGVSFDTR